MAPKRQTPNFLFYLLSLFYKLKYTSTCTCVVHLCVTNTLTCVVYTVRHAIVKEKRCDSKSSIQWFVRSDGAILHKKSCRHDKALLLGYPPVLSHSLVLLLFRATHAYLHLMETGFIFWYASTLRCGVSLLTILLRVTAPDQSEAWDLKFIELIDTTHSSPLHFFQSNLFVLVCYQISYAAFHFFVLVFYTVGIHPLLRVGFFDMQCGIRSSLSFCSMRFTC